jgi:hypothetical protein
MTRQIMLTRNKTRNIIENEYHSINESHTQLRFLNEKQLRNARYAQTQNSYHVRSILVLGKHLIMNTKPHQKVYM